MRRTSSSRCNGERHWYKSNCPPSFKTNIQSNQRISNIRSRCSFRKSKKTWWRSRSRLIGSSPKSWIVISRILWPSTTLACEIDHYGKRATTPTQPSNLTWTARSEIVLSVSMKSRKWTVPSMALHLPSGMWRWISILIIRSNKGVRGRWYER